jgi:acetyl-CoA C-acetyltransferase
MSRNVVIVDGARTPFDKFGGPLKDLNTVQLAAHVTRKLIERNPVKPEDIEEYYLGINMPTSSRSIARQAALAAGLPVTINATTTDRACCSSMVAIAMAMRAIQLGDAEIAIGGGSENMSNVPYFLEDLRWGKRLGEVVLKDILYVSCPYTGEPRAKQAGEVALEYGVTREMQDEWAYRSQKLYDEAFKVGKFKDEIVAIELPQKKGDPIVIQDDQSPRPGTTLEALAKLKPVNQSPTVTAGNAPGLSTGAAMALLMSGDEAKKRGIKPLATIIAHAQASEHPKGIASIPAHAAKKALKKAGMTIEQMDVVEINEAFAAMPLVSTILMGEKDEARIAAIREKTNVNGGAIAIGHPTGATGARLLMTMIRELKRRGGGYGLCTICGGVGESECFIVKV